MVRMRARQGLKMVSQFFVPLELKRLSAIYFYSNNNIDIKSLKKENYRKLHFLRYTFRELPDPDGNNKSNSKNLC